MRIEVIKNKLEEKLENHEITIYSIKQKREFGEKILEILLKGKDINSELLAEIHLELFESLEDGDLDDDHFLELSSMGAEYPLENLQDIIDHIGRYVALETNNFKAIGTILDVDGNTIILEYNNKGQFRKLKIEYDTIRMIRTSVKI